VDWESSGPTYTLNKLRNELCAAAKFKFDVNKIFLFGLIIHAKNPKKKWIVRTINLESIDYLRHPTNSEELLDVDANKVSLFVLLMQRIQKKNGLFELLIWKASTI